MSNTVKARWIGEELNCYDALTQPGDTGEWQWYCDNSQPRIGITREQARVICETYERVARGTVAFLSSSTVESMKAVVEAALNGDSKWH